MAEDELHAYVDGLLAPERRGSVESYLSSAPCEAERVRAYRAQNLELHRLFDRPAFEPVPPRYERLAAELTRAIRRQRMARWVVSSAAVAGMATFAVVAGWSGLERYRVDEFPLLAFAQQATQAHLMAVGKIDAADLRERAGEGLLSRLPPGRAAGMPLPSPDLVADEGFALAGGRILPTGHGPAVQLVYANKAGRRVTLFIGPASTGHRGTFTILEESDVSLVYWQMGQLGYSLVGNVDRKTLLGLAESVVGSLAGPDNKPARGRDAMPPAAEPSIPVAGPVVRMPDAAAPAAKAAPALPAAEQAKPLATGVVRETPQPAPRVRPQVSDIKLEPRT